MLTPFFLENKAGKASPSLATVPKVSKSSCESDGMDCPPLPKDLFMKNKGLHSVMVNHVYKERARIEWTTSPLILLPGAGGFPASLSPF